MSTVTKYTWPTTNEIRGRMAMAREIAFNPLAGPFFVSESEQDLFNLATRLHQALTAALADLDLYVGKEPTQAEEMAYLSSEVERLTGEVDRLTRENADLEIGLGIGGAS